MRFRLLPTDDGFFELFDAAASNVLDCGGRLRELLDDASFGTPGAIADVVACEQRGDELTRTIMRRLNTSFVTPFDREDIHALAEELDDVVDDMLEVAYQLDLGDRSLAEMPELKQQADVLVQMAGEVIEMTSRLRSMKGLQPHLDAIGRLESEGDGIYRQAMRRIYCEDLEARAVLYWKVVLDAMEDALDTMEDFSDVVEAIVLKHA